MLSGDRVLLRPIQREDLPRLWELVEDFEVAVLGSPGPIVPHSRAELETKFDKDLAQPQKDHAYFAIEVDGELVGEAGLHRIDHFNRTCELGIGIGRPYWGKGFGQDAVRTLVDYAFEHLNMNRIASTCLPRTPGPWGRTAEPGSSRRAGCGSMPSSGAGTRTSS